MFQKILPEKEKPVLLLLQYGPKDAREETLTLINVGFLYSQCQLAAATSKGSPQKISRTNTGQILHQIIELDSGVHAIMCGFFCLKIRWAVGEGGADGCSSPSEKGVKRSTFTI